MAEGDQPELLEGKRINYDYFETWVCRCNSAARSFRRKIVRTGGARSS